MNPNERMIEVEGYMLRIVPWASRARSGYDVLRDGVQVGTMYSDGDGRACTQIGRHIRGSIEDVAIAIHRRTLPAEAGYPKPGTAAAAANGCTCPRLANRFGVGNEGRFFLDPECNIHGSALRCTA
jgi:hypothetical protein